MAYLRAQYSKWKSTFAALQLQLEDDKTKLFHVHTYQMHLPGKPLYIGPLPSLNIRMDTTLIIIQAQQSWCYLGFQFDPHLTFKLHVNTWTTKGSMSLRACKMLGNSHHGLSPKDKCLIYLTTTLPILMYGFQLWYCPHAKGCKALLKTLEKIHLAVARWITGGFLDSPRNALLSITSLNPLQVMLDKLYFQSSL
ncbi:hypothetical protein AX15_005461 [Amanita polypyramis BW_CC]|nr:hypothetical protein AX15_005461 [Amanita polypyramis BW_CC]